MISCADPATTDSTSFQDCYVQPDCKTETQNCSPERALSRGRLAPAESSSGNEEKPEKGLFRDCLRRPVWPRSSLTRSTSPPPVRPARGLQRAYRPCLLRVERRSCRVGIPTVVGTEVRLVKSHVSRYTYVCNVQCVNVNTPLSAARSCPGTWPRLSSRR